MSLSVNDRMILECPENYNDMEQQLGIGDAAEESVKVNGEAVKEAAAKDYDEEDLEDLEQSLQALESIEDRSSPDLWPDHIPGVGQFLPATPYKDSLDNTPRGSESGYLHNLSREEVETLMQLGSLSMPQLMNEVKRLQNIAYQLGQEESKEMTRGKYLNILKKRNNSSQS